MAENDASDGKGLKTLAAYIGGLTAVVTALFGLYQALKQFSNEPAEQEEAAPPQAAPADSPASPPQSAQPPPSPPQAGPASAPRPPPLGSTPPSPAVSPSPSPPTGFQTSTGTIIRHDGVWYAYPAGSSQPTDVLHQQYEDAQYYLLYDQRRNVYIRLPKHGGMAGWSQTSPGVFTDAFYVSPIGG